VNTDALTRIGARRFARPEFHKINHLVPYSAEDAVFVAGNPALAGKVAARFGRAATRIMQFHSAGILLEAFHALGKAVTQPFDELKQQTDLYR